MVSGWLALGVALQLASAAPSRSLGGAAHASPRPAECAPHRVTAWDRARAPEVARWCDLLARGFAELATSPPRALQIARIAEEIAPGRAGTALLEGRAAAAAGQWKRALSAFERARALDPRSVDDPASLEDLALALEADGRAAEALGAWRSLVARADLAAGEGARARVLLEASRRALASGPAGLDEAIAWLREARRAGARERLAEVLATLALALDRAGSGAELRALQAEARRLGFRPRGELAGEPLAVAALALEPVDAARAARAWESYLAAAKDGPWAAHARARLAGLARIAVAPKAPKAPK